jgi:capsular polysaccharide biosynthesis protein
MTELRFHIDELSTEVINGWVDRPGAASHISLLVNGTVVGDFPANTYRPDLEAAGIGDGWRAFSIPMRRHLRAGPNRITLNCAGKTLIDVELLVDDFRMGVDLFDLGQLNGWADAFGPASPLSLFVNDKLVGDYDATTYRADLEAAGIGDGQRGFNISLRHHVQSGLNHIALKWAERIVFDDYLFRGSFEELCQVLNRHEHKAPADSGTALLRPLDGQQIVGPNMIVAVRLDRPADNPTCRIYSLKDYIQKPLEQCATLSDAELQPFKGNPDIRWAQLGGLASNRNLICLVFGSEGQVLAGAVARTAHWSASDFSGPSHSVAPAQIVGPLKFAHAQFSHYKEADETSLRFDERSAYDLLAYNHESRREFIAISSEEFHDPVHTFDLKLSMGRGIPRFDELAAEAPWRSPAGYFCSLANVKLAMLPGFPIFEDKYAWGDARRPTGNLDPLYTKVSGSFYVGGEFFVALPEHKVFDGDRIPMMLFLTYNYAHWLMNSATAAWYAKRLYGDRVTFILPIATPLMLETLAFLGIDRSSILEVGADLCSFPRVIYPSLMSTFNVSSPNSHDNGAYHALKSGVQRTFAALEDAPRRIYVSRRGGLGAVSRDIENEEDLIAALARAGFQTIRPHEHSLAEQINLFSKAEIVVSITGAQLTNLAFAPRGCSVIEICGASGMDNTWLRFSHVFGHHYVRVMVESEQKFRAGGYRIKAPVDAICEIIASITSNR